eukprot:SAG11_NODE_6392_length_1322_cov_5.195421_1_plen_138_part_00
MVDSYRNAASTTPTGCVPVCDVLADGGEITRASGAARAGGAERRRRGDMHALYGLMERATLDTAREVAKAEVLVARATNTTKGAVGRQEYGMEYGTENGTAEAAIEFFNAWVDSRIQAIVTTEVAMCESNGALLESQ